MQLEPQTRAEVEEVADLVGRAGPRLSRAIRWNRLTFAVEGNWHHWLCGIAVTKKAGNLVFHKGSLLDDPERLLGGDGRYVRQLPLTTARARPSAVVRLVCSALDHETDLLG
jgi:hypothetical protein